jgi:hypothetical protein
VVFEPHNQILRARNRGAQAAAGEWLLFIDADSTPTSGLFEELRNAVERGDVLAAAAPSQPKARRDSASPSAPGMRSGGVTRWAAGLLHLLPRDGVFLARGFSEELYASEELEFFQRVKPSRASAASASSSCTGIRCARATASCGSTAGVSCSAISAGSCCIPTGACATQPTASPGTTGAARIILKQCLRLEGALGYCSVMTFANRRAVRRALMVGALGSSFAEARPGGHSAAAVVARSFTRLPWSRIVYA